MRNEIQFELQKTMPARKKKSSQLHKFLTLKKHNGTLNAILMNLFYTFHSFHSGKAPETMLSCEKSGSSERL